MPWQEIMAGLIVVAAGIAYDAGRRLLSRLNAEDRLLAIDRDPAAVAAGAGLSSKVRDSGQVVVCFFGDGTTNIGAFHESLNFAKVWELPVVFVCENNLYMEYTPISSVTAVPNPAADRAASYGLDRIIVDGNDADAVYEAALSVIDRARAGGFLVGARAGAPQVEALQRFVMGQGNRRCLHAGRHDRETQNRTGG